MNPSPESASPSLSSSPSLNPPATPPSLIAGDVHSKIRLAAQQMGLTESEFCFLLAAKQGNCDMLRKLLHQGVPLDTKDRSGATALIYSSTAGHFAAVRLLLEAGASPSAKDAAGDTALHLACRRDCANIASLLVEHGAGLFTENARGWCPVDELGANPSLKEKLLEAEARRKAASDPCAARTTAQGDGLAPPEGARLRQPLEFAVYPTCQFGQRCFQYDVEKFHIEVRMRPPYYADQPAEEVRNPGSALLVRREVRSDGRIQVLYTPVVEGDYLVTVTYNGEHIVGSPFKFALSESGNYGSTSPIPSLSSSPIPDSSSTMTSPAISITPVQFVSSSLNENISFPSSSSSSSSPISSSSSSSSISISPPSITPTTTSSSLNSISSSPSIHPPTVSPPGTTTSSSTPTVASPRLTHLPTPSASMDALIQENTRLQALVQDLTSSHQQQIEKIKKQTNQLAFLSEELKATRSDVCLLSSKLSSHQTQIKELLAEKQIRDREFAHLHRKFGGVINTETDNIIKCGWGWKLPPKGGSVWQRRFFALFTNRELSYFEEKGTINLAGCAKPLLVPESHCVSLKSKERQYSFFFEPSAGSVPPELTKRETSHAASISRPKRETTRRSTSTITSIFGDSLTDANMQWYSVIMSLKEVDQTTSLSPQSSSSRVMD